MRTTTDPNNWGFVFTISDLAKYLGKSPVTIRGWERNGEIRINRDQSGDRRLSSEGIRNVAAFAYQHKRISRHRFRLIESAMTLVEQLQKENSR